MTRGSDDLARLTSGTTFWAAKFDRGSSSTTKSFSGIEASVVNRSAAWTVPSRSAATVSGPPASRARNSRERAVVEPLQARDAVGALLELRRAAEGDRRAQRREVLDRAQVVLRGERPGDDDGVLVLRGALREQLELGRQLGGDLLVDLVRRRGRGLRVEELQQVAGVVGHQVDLAALDGGVVRLAAADAEAALDGDALALQGRRVDLGDQPVLGEVRRADADRALRRRAGGGGGERVGAAAAAGEQRAGGQRRPATNRARGDRITVETSLAVGSSGVGAGGRRAAARGRGRA